MHVNSVCNSIYFQRKWKFHLQIKVEGRGSFNLHKYTRIWRICASTYDVNHFFLFKKFSKRMIFRENDFILKLLENKGEKNTYVTFYSIAKCFRWWSFQSIHWQFQGGHDPKSSLHYRGKAKYLKSEKYSIREKKYRNLVNLTRPRI